MTDINAAESPEYQASLIERLRQVENRLSRLEAKRAINDYQGWDTYETWVISLWMDNDTKQAVKM
jgi:hypothetical protein